MVQPVGGHTEYESLTRGLSGGIQRSYLFELRVFDEHRARALVAAVELVSPGNKDRPESRAAFVDKCSAYLRDGISLLILDIVTSRRHNFHADLMENLNAGETTKAVVASDLYAVAYRARVGDKRTQLEGWHANLTLGEPLPTLPLWLGQRLYVPLELEPTYQTACRYAGIMR
jgi:hypothetical protein